MNDGRGVVDVEVTAVDQTLSDAVQIERLRHLLIRVLVAEGRCPTRLLIEISKALDEKEIK